MWELNGQQFSLEQIEAILNKEKYKGSVDDFIAERGYTKISQPKAIEEDVKIKTYNPKVKFNENEQNILNNFNNIPNTISQEEVKEFVINKKRKKFEQVDKIMDPLSVNYSIDNVNKVLKQNNITYDEYLAFRNGAEIVPSEAELLEETNLRIHNEKLNFLDDIPDEVRKKINAKLNFNIEEGAEQLGYKYNTEEGFVEIDTEGSFDNLLGNINTIAKFDNKDELVGGDLYDVTKKIENLVYSVDEAVKNGTWEQANQTLIIQDYNNLLEKQKNLVNTYEDLVNEQLNLRSNVMSNVENVKYFSKKYEGIEKSKATIKNIFTNMPLAGLSILDFVVSDKNVFLKEKIGEKIDDWLDVREFLDKEQKKNLPAPRKLSGIRSVEDFVNYSADVLYSNTPYAAMAFIGGINTATTLFTLSGMGDKAAELGLDKRKYENIDVEKLKKIYNETDDGLEKLFIEVQLEEHDRVMNLGEGTKFMSILTHGLAESLPARFIGGIKIAQGIKNTYRGIGEANWKNFTKNFLYKNPRRESGEEFITNTFQNIGDIFWLDKDVSIFENADEAAVQGWISGKAFSAAELGPTVYGSLLHVSQTHQDKKLMQTKLGELNTYLENLKNPELTGKSRLLIRKKANEIKNEMITLADQNLAKLKGLEPSQILQLGELDREMRNINNEWRQAVSSKQISEKGLNQLRKNLKAKFDILKNQKANILGEVTREQEIEIDGLTDSEQITEQVKRSNALYSGLPVDPTMLKGVTVTAKKIAKKGLELIKTGDTEIKGEVLTETKQPQTVEQVAESIQVPVADVTTMVDKVANRAVAKYFRGIPKNIREKAGLDRKTYLDSAKAELLLIAKKYDSSRVDKDDNQITFDRYMANTGMQRLNDLATRLGVESAEGPTTVSVEAEQVKEIADPSTVETTETVTETGPATINVFGKGPQAEVLESQTVGAIQASDLGQTIQAAENIKIADLNKLNEEVSAPLLAEELNIPVEVIIDPKININDQHNPTNIQQFLLKNEQQLKNFLKANTNVEVVESLNDPNVTIKVGGKPLRLPRKILNLYFDKTDVRVGKEGYFQYKIKPEVLTNWKNTFRSSVGISPDGKVDPTFINRSGEAQTAKGWLQIISRLRTNAALEGITTGKVAGTILSATPKKVKTATERAIDYLTAKEAEFKNITLIGIPPNALFSTLKGALKLYNGTNIKAVINYIKNKLRQFSVSAANAISRIFANTVSKAADGIVFIDQVLAWGYGEKRTTLNDVLEGNGLEGVYDLNDRSEGGGRDQYKNFLKTTLFPMMPKSFWMNKKQITGSRQGILTTKEVEGILNSMKDSDFGAPIDKVTSYVRKKYATVFGVTGKSTLQALNSEKGKEFNNNNILIWESLLTRMNDIIKKDPETARGFALAFKGVGEDVTHWFKLGAEVIAADPKSKKLHWEHALPATAAYKYLLNSMLNKNINFETTLELIKNNYKVIAVDTKDNTKIDKAKLKENMPSWWTIFDNWYDRYFNSQVGSINGGINPNSIQLADGKTLAEAFNINSNLGTQETINIEAEIKEAETINQGETAIKNNPNLVPTAPKNLNKDFNIILEEVKGIAAKKRFSQIVARRVGRNKGRISKFFFGPGAQDFELLYYNFLGRGRKGEQQKRFFEDNLMKPYARGVAKMEVYAQQLKNDFAALKKLMPDTATILYNNIKGLNYTNDQALRIYLWDKAGYDIPGLSKRDRTAVVKHVQSNPNLIEFANGLTALSKQDNWVKPGAYWDTSDLLKDIYNLGNQVGRKQFLQEFINNSNKIFSESNLNKIEATYGIYLREAIEGSLYRMKTGTNRKEGMDRNTAAATQWISNSVGAIMFMNVRAASFQLLSTFNYINWQENNIFAIGQRVLDVKQLSKDIYTILTSPKIKQRFAGEGRGIEESEIANALRNARNKPAALLQYLLKIGFTFTRAADAMAIALGGAPYYRNNVIAFEKQGFSKEEAEAKAWEKFSETTEKFQQSSDPRLLSQDQATTMGRWILAFQNTPGQYMRSNVKDMKDFINRRRIPGLTQLQSDATYISRISYYGVIQNFAFVALANALFTMLPGWADEEEEELDKKAERERNKQIRTINNMISTLLRGSGIYGAFVDTLKNVVMAYYKEQGKDPFAKDNANILVEITNLMPTVGSKIRKINNSLRGEDYNKDLIKERGWDVTIDGKVNLSPKYQVFSNLVEGVTNIPLARMTDEVTRITEMLDARNTTLERVALTLGYRPWDLNIPNEEHDKLRLEISDRKRKEKQEKKRLEKEEKKRLEDEKRFAGKSDEEIELMKTQDKIRKLTKAEQVTELEGLGLSKKDIRALRLENDRINKIIELREKKKTK
jgi:hypothetical protein